MQYTSTYVITLLAVSLFLRWTEMWSTLYYRYYRHYRYETVLIQNESVSSYGNHNVRFAESKMVNDRVAN